MRTSLNPAKQSGAAAYKAENLGIVTITYIPDQVGFYQNSLDIFLIHAASVRKNTNAPFNYFVFDNGSCEIVQETLKKLQKAGWIDWLFLSSRNLGKLGGLNMAVPAMPNEWICYSDSDILFRPGWLEESFKIHENFPECGMSGAQVVIPDWEEDKGNTLFRRSTKPEYVFSKRRLEPALVDEYCRARSVAPDRAADFRQTELDFVTNTFTGTQAIMGGNSHQQWLARKKDVIKTFPLPAKFQMNRRESTYMDVKIDELGQAHLTTTQQFVYHMGNVLDPEIIDEVNPLQAELEKLGFLENKPGSRSAHVKAPSVSPRKSGIIRLLMRRLYLALYRRLYL